MLVEAIGTPLPPLSKCFLLKGNKKGGSAKAEVKSGWYGAPHNRAAVFYNRGGAGVTGLMMETVPPSPIQAYKRIFCSTRSWTEKRKVTKKRGGGGIQTKRVRLKNLPAPTRPEKGNASERLRDSSGPHLNSSSWILIYRRSLSDTLEKGSGDPLSSAERTMGHKGPDLLGRSWGMPSSCPLLSADASGSKNDWWCVRESW